MSQFSTTTVSCPGCGADVPFDAVHSVNIDRSPALRDRILDESFQRTACPKCSTEFRLEPDFNYVDHGSALWIAAKPLHRLPHWKEEEDLAQGLFERVYGARGSVFMQNIGKTLRRRLTFGWAAVREKLVVDDHALDDVTLELCKSAVLRNSPSAPVGLGAELRLVAVAEDQALVLGWMHSQDESVAQTVRVARSLYEQIAEDAEGAWAELREELSAGAFVDMNRMLVTAER
jgi:hypothetical protein